MKTNVIFDIPKVSFDTLVLVKDNLRAILSAYTGATTSIETIETFADIYRTSSIIRFHIESYASWKHNILCGIIHQSVNADMNNGQWSNIISMSIFDQPET